MIGDRVYLVPVAADRVPLAERDFVSVALGVVLHDLFAECVSLRVRWFAAESRPGPVSAEATALNTVGSSETVGRFSASMPDQIWLRRPSACRCALARTLAHEARHYWQHVYGRLHWANSEADAENFADRILPTLRREISALRSCHVSPPLATAGWRK